MLVTRAGRSAGLHGFVRNVGRSDLAGCCGKAGIGIAIGLFIGLPFHQRKQHGAIQKGRQGSELPRLRNEAAR